MGQATELIAGARAGAGEGDGDKSGGAVATSLRRALTALFALERLPANPCHWLCVRLRAHEDQSALWALGERGAAREVCDSVRAMSGAGAAEHLARTDGPNRDAMPSNTAYGLPHLAQATQAEGFRRVTAALHSLPDSLMPRSTKELGDFGVHSLVSVCAPSAFFRASVSSVAQAGADLPGQLELQVDMVVGGPNIGGALETYAAVIGSDVRDVHLSDVHLVRGVSLPAELQGIEELRPPLGEMSGTSSSMWRAEDVLSQPREFVAAVKRCASTKCRASLHCVVAVDAEAEDAAAAEAHDAIDGAGAGAPGRTMRYVVLTKHYVFHFRHSPQQRAASREETSAYVRHFANEPYEALFNGVFLDSGAATSYSRLFFRAHGMPFDMEHTSRVLNGLLDRLLHEHSVGAHLQAMQTLHLLTLLMRPVLDFEIDFADERGYTPPEILELEQLAEKVLGGIVCGLSGATSAFEALAYECVALQEVLAAEPTQYASARLGIASAQLASIAARARRIFCNAPVADFSGVAGLIDRTMAALEAPETLSTAPLSRTARQLGVVGDICEAAALTLAEALPRRCPAVARTVQLAGELRPKPPPPPVAVVELLGALVAASAHEQASRPTHSRDLIVDHAVMESLRLRASPPAVARPAVCLQYSIDHRLDDTLAEVHRAINTPPVPLNPFPSALRVLRARATEQEVPLIQPPSAAVEKFSNVLFQTSSGPVYGTRWRRWDHPSVAAVAAGVAERAGVESPAVFGTYAAVHAVHAEATLRAAALLGGALTQRCEWQAGAYSFEVAVGLSGDLSVGNCIETGAYPPAPGVAGTDSTMPMLQVHLEELHVCSGINMTQAARLFAEALMQRAEELQANTRHVVECVSTGAFSRGEEERERGEGSGSGGRRRDWAMSDMLASQRLRERCVEALAAEGAAGADVTLRIVARAGDGYAPLRVRCRLHLIGADPYYDLSAYSTVFLSPEDALLFLTMGRASGDPGAPVHRNAAAVALSHQMNACERRGDMLGVHRAMLRHICVTQDFARVGYASRVLRSHALEIRLMRATGRALARLAEVRDAVVQEKLEPGAAVTTLAAYAEGCALLLESPQCSVSFTGVRPRALWALASTRKQVGGAGMGSLRGEDSTALRRVNVWLKAVEYSVASALHDAVERTPLQL